MGPDSFLYAIYYLYIIILILLTLGLVAIGIPRRITEENGDSYTPRTLVMVPCRGLDYSLEKNLESITRQDYPDYDVVAIIDSNEDPCVGILQKLSIPYLISTFECKACSGKTKAISTAIVARPNYEAYIICDSDIRVKKDWLSSIISPLGNNNTGLSTTFPYFNPVGGFWSKIKSVWGIVGQGLMESNLTRFGWGGSLAFKSDLLDADSFKLFSESVSDDTSLSSICKSKGLPISYSRKAQPLIDSPDDFSTFFEWSNRQTALSISASRSVYRYGIIVYVSMIMVFLSAIVLTAFDSAYFLFLFAPLALSEINNVRRSNKVFPLLFLITVILPFLFLLNLLLAARMDHITWRGRTYKLQKERQ